MNQVGCIASSEHPKVFSHQVLTENTNFLRNSRYCYRNNKNIDDLYIFEIILEGFNDDNTNFRKITRERSGSLIHLEDSILYDNIRKIELSALDVNKPCNEVHINYKLNHDNNKLILIKYIFL